MRRRGFKMGLEQDIKDAFITNLTYKVNKKNVNPITSDKTNKAEKKINQLSEDLSKAIIDFIKAQTFTVTKLKASQVAVPSTPAAVPIITVKIDEKNLAADNPMSGLESSQSEVKLKTAVEV